MTIDSSVLISLVSAFAIAISFGGYYGFTIWNRLRPGYMRVYIRQSDNTMRSFWLPIQDKEGTSVVVVGESTYLVVPDCIERMTRWRLPTSWYIAGVPTPLNWGELKLDTGITSEQLHAALESHVIREAISSFVPPALFTPSLAVIIAGVMILGALGLGYYYVNGQFEELTTLVAEAIRSGGITP
jgi:hypothetical protein